MYKDAPDFSEPGYLASVAEAGICCDRPSDPTTLSSAQRNLGTPAYP